MAQVLVVDDSSTVRSEVSTFLESHGIDVVTAVDGMDGLEKFKKEKGLKLIICDVNMPKLDGLSMIEKIKQIDPDIPVIMLATQRDPSLKQRGREAGVRGWIVKPFNGESALVGIKKFIS